MSPTVTATWVYPADLLYQASEPADRPASAERDDEPDQRHPILGRLAWAVHKEHSAPTAGT